MKCGLESPALLLGPASASANSARSATLRAIGPFCAYTSKGFRPGLVVTSPGDGRRLVTPQKLAGVRNDPPRSEPCANQAVPLASAAAAPPEEPPALRVVS